MISLLDAERTAYCELLTAREEEKEFQKLETAIFEAWLAASKSSSTARKREEAAFDTWYAASKALDNKERLEWAYCDGVGFTPPSLQRSPHER